MGVYISEEKRLERITLADKGLKRCYTCNSIKSVTLGFYKHKGKPDGASSNCKNCTCVAKLTLKESKSRRAEEEVRRLDLASKGLKKCTSCATVQPYSEYYKCSGVSDGLKAQCKPCSLKVTGAEWEEKKQKKAEHIRLHSEAKKKCACCGVIQPYSKFTLQPTGIPISYCKPCSAKKDRESRRMAILNNKKTQDELQLFSEGKRKCNTCATTKSLEEFGVSYDVKSGRKAQCKVCTAIKKKQYRAQSREQIRIYERNYREGNSQARLVASIRSRVYDLITKPFGKQEATLELLGCTKEHFVLYLESLFLDGMSWDNYGLTGWELDHSRPCASYDLSLERDRQECFNYLNYRPMWAVDNRSKGSFYNGTRHHHKKELSG